MRDLTIRDAFVVSGILSKVNRDDVNGLMTVTDTASYGVNFVLSLMGALGDNADDILRWLADVKEMPFEEFEKLPPSELFVIVEELKEREDLKSFFERALKLLGGKTERQ